MGRTRAETKAALLARAEELIDELLDWAEQMPQPNLTQIEEAVLKLRKRLERVMNYGKTPYFPGLLVMPTI